MYPDDDDQPQVVRLRHIPPMYPPPVWNVHTATIEGSTPRPTTPVRAKTTKSLTLWDTTTLLSGSPSASSRRRQPQSRRCWHRTVSAKLPRRGPRKAWFVYNVDCRTCAKIVPVRKRLCWSFLLVLDRTPACTVAGMCWKKVALLLL